LGGRRGDKKGGSLPVENFSDDRPSLDGSASKKKKKPGIAGPDPKILEAGGPAGGFERTTPKRIHTPSGGNLSGLKTIDP